MQFEAFCALWEVVQPDRLLDENDNWLLGQCNMDDTTIEVAKRGRDGEVLKARDRFETFWHEVAHVIDFCIHHEEGGWSHNEIDMVGRLLAQITWSMK
jgi:hypothetical protein